MRKGKIEIDLTGPDGNAFFLIARARQYATSLGYDETSIEEMLNEMKSADYDHLIQVFDNHFGDYVDLYR